MPEFLREGSAVADYFAPPKIVVGTRDGMPEPVIQDLTKNAISDRQTQQKYPHGKLAMISPFDIENPFGKLPHFFFDTTQSRRHLQKTFGVPYIRPPELPSRDWRFLRHDVTLIDELVTIELTARTHSTPFGYESHYGLDGELVYPRLAITGGSLSHTL